MNLLVLLFLLKRSFSTFVSNSARHFTWVFAGFALALGLMSCGGGGGEGGVSGGGTGGGTPGPISVSAPAISFGAIGGLGSIFINAFEFDDALNLVTSQDGFPVSASDLGMGVQVSVLNEKTSQTLNLTANNRTGGIQIKRLFLGVLQENGADIKKGLVNGQTVYFDRFTVVDGAPNVISLRGTLVQVAGFLEPTLNTVVVTRIEPASAAQIAQNQVYVTARVQSIDLTNSSVSLGFATVSLAAIQPAQAVEVNDVIRVQGSFSSASTSTLLAAKLSKIRPLAGLGGATFGGIVNSRPTVAASNTPVLVDGYEVQLTATQIAALVDLRRGSLVRVTGALDGTVLKNASLAIISNPKITLPGEVFVADLPIINPSGRPLRDYLISNSPVESVNADGSFVVRGTRVVLFIPSSGTAPTVQVGQVVSLAGQALADALGFYIFAELIL